MDALMMAVWRRGKADALLHHSDQWLLQIAIYQRREGYCMDVTIAEAARKWVRANIAGLEFMPEHQVLGLMLKALEDQGFDVRDFGSLGLEPGEILRDERWLISGYQGD